MDTTTVRDLFSIAEDHGAEWYDANRAMISRTTPALGFEAFTDREHVKAYFFYLEKNPNGYTVFEFSYSTGRAAACSGIGQFYDEETAEQACIALAKERITPEMCRGAYKSRKARTVDGIMIYKRNQARTGTIQEWREDQKTRVIPKKQPAASEFVAAYVSEHFPKHAITSLIERLQQSV